MLALVLSLVAAAAQPNLLLVTIDTLRADHVGAYGRQAAATPAMDRLAREGILLEDAVVQVPQTRPSHACLLTGRYPFEHGLRDNAEGPLRPDVATLAELLARQGYDTGGFIGAYPVSRDSGLDRGFAVFDDPFTTQASVATRDDRSERRAGEVVDKAVAWLARPRAAAFFAWVHLFDPHAPYAPPSPFKERFGRSPYDGEVAYADSQIARLLAWLDGAGRAGDTLVVVTSDHGEGLGDHGEDEHLFFVYDSTLKVPLLLRWPGRLKPGTRVPGQFRSIDLVATLLDLLGLPAAPTSGASRAAALREGSRIPDNESYAETLYPRLHYGYAELRALRAEGFKLIDAPRPELYRVSEDPGETRNLVDLRGQVASGMRARLLTYDRATGTAAPSLVSAETQERLAALGYVSGGFEGKPSGADPKDKIAGFQAGRRAENLGLELFRKRDFAGAVRALAKLAEPVKTKDGQLVERKSFNVDFYLGQSLLELRRFREAAAPLERASALSPKSVPALVFLARAYAGAGRAREAAATVERGLRLAPANAELHQTRGRLGLQSGDAAAARADLEKAMSLDPNNPLVRIDLATLHRTNGELKAARAEAEAAVRLDPASAEAQVALGLAAGAQGEEALGARCFRRALELRPGDPDALFYAAASEVRAGRPGEAAPLLDELSRRVPSYPGAAELKAAARQLAAPAAAGFARLRLLRVEERPRAEEAARRAASGDDFAALARELSVDASASAGGDLGLVRLGDLAEPLRSAAAALPAGGVSPVLETARGYVVLKREK